MPNLDLLHTFYRADAKHCLTQLIHYLGAYDADPHIEARATRLIIEIRQQRIKKGVLNAFMAEYDLSNAEGIALMCLAEALLRIPDSLTADRLIRDKLSKGNWKKHWGNSESLFVNATSYALQWASKIVNEDDLNPRALKNALFEFCKKHSKNTVRHAVRYAMGILGNNFVMGETIAEAEERALKNKARGYTYSYDMLGEAARTEKDALAYLEDYKNAIHVVGKGATEKTLYQKSGVSIKLSALHPRYEYQNPQRMFAELYPRVKALCLLAKEYDIALTIDAEESDRLIPSLEILTQLAADSDLKTWQGLGLAVQAYQQRAFYVLDYLKALAEKTQRRLMVRLVKGAYWDSEIKLAQEQGLENYPVFTRKVYTDVSYLACAKKMLDYRAAFYPMFATHNALTVSAIVSMAGAYRDYEFQCLHGMGDTLYDQIVDPLSEIAMPCRIYAPVGSHKHLLAYLVRRLLENGANSSFVNQILDPKIAISSLVKNPVTEALRFGLEPHPAIPSPRNIYGEYRMNAKGLDLSNPHTLMQVVTEIDEASKDQWLALPMLAERMNLADDAKKALYNPANTTEVIGHVIEAGLNEVELALTSAEKAFPRWSGTSVAERAALLKRVADLLETNMSRFLALAIKEAGKTIPNAIGEVREAIDFCRYYAQQAEKTFGTPTTFQGITGESNTLEWQGRGIIVCISPWNFPLAIFLGEITAALAAGNVVIAKPAEQTPLIATLAVELLHQAGFPRDVVQMLPGAGAVIGAKLTADPRVAGVIFTGSTATARLINETLAKKPGPIVPFIAETGGQNAMIVDSSALPEQVVRDVMTSSFDSAGQRCSALRVLFLQQDIADTVITMLTGAMAELQIGNPLLLTTDVGPVIDAEAQKNLDTHLQTLRTTAKILYEAPLPTETKQGYFVAPTLIEIADISVLKGEVFGPILHVIRFHASQIDNVIAQVNSTGFGLTFGIHSRIDSFIDYIKARIHAGNIYVNRNMVGAVVGVQPFGGEGISGTGPKAGGPYYLPRLAVERVISINTTASGGNASLMTLST